MIAGSRKHSRTLIGVNLDPRLCMRPWRVASSSIFLEPPHRAGAD
jgi:hypothetical protein